MHRGGLLPSGLGPEYKVRLRLDQERALAAILAAYQEPGSRPRWQPVTRSSIIREALDLWLEKGNHHAMD
jgi:hypothetical protein